MLCKRCTARISYPNKKRTSVIALSLSRYLLKYVLNHLLEPVLTDQKTRKNFDNHDLNTYEGIAEYYDTLMTDGYYDYNEISDSLCEVIGDRTDILELGVGTGLVVEKVLERKPNFKITGVDNTQAMIEKAQTRIGNRMTYELQDVTKLDLPNKFDAAFSV